jgi:hypothetical protein
MQDMPGPRPPHLHREVTRHGKAVWYARAGDSSRGPRIRLHAEFGTAEFWAEYQAALASVPHKPRPRMKARWPGSSSDTARRRLGPICRRPLVGNAKTSLNKSSGRRVRNHSPRSPRQPPWQAVTGVLTRHTRRVIFLMQCEVFSGGQ